MRIPIDENLTHDNTELQRQIGKTHCGQAHLAGTGPFGKTCAECAHYGCFRKVIDHHSGAIIRTVAVKACAKFQQLTGKIGPVIPGYAEACRYFERRCD